MTIVNTEAYNSHFIHVISFLNNLALQFMLRTFITDQKKHCFWICRDEKKSSPWQLQIYFFYLLFRGYSLFFLSLFCLFFIPVFFFSFCFWLFACFLKLKLYILIHIWLWGRVSDKKSLTQPISENKTTFLWPNTP